MISAKFRVFDGGVAMRRLALVAVMFGAVSGAQAADMPDFLRGSLPAGPVPMVNWQGYYIGAQAGYGSSDEKFRRPLPAGPVPMVNWQGYYIGAQAGYGSSDENFSGSNSTMLAALLSNNVIEE